MAGRAPEASNAGEFIWQFPGKQLLRRVALESLAVGKSVLEHLVPLAGNDGFSVSLLQDLILGEVERVRRVEG